MLCLLLSELDGAALQNDDPQRFLVSLLLGVEEQIPSQCTPSPLERFVYLEQKPMIRLVKPIINAKSHTLDKNQ